MATLQRLPNGQVVRSERGPFPSNYDPAAFGDGPDVCFTRKSVWITAGLVTAGIVIFLVSGGRNTTTVVTPRR